MPKKIIPYKSFKDQFTIKIPEKDINISLHSEDISILRLKNHSYYALINGYKAHFLLPKEKDKMRPNTSFEHFFACKMLEMDIGAIYLKYLLVIEQGFRNRVANIIAREYSTDEDIYTKRANYVNTDNTLGPLLDLLEEKIKFPSENSYSHYFKSQNYSIPPWILVLDINFYDVITWYSCLQDFLRDEIRDDYLPIGKNNQQQNKNFANSMHLLREYRNIFAHSKRNFSEKIHHSIKLSYYRLFPACNINFPGNFDTSRNSKTLLTCTLVILEYLRDDVLKGRFIRDLSTLLVKDEYINLDFSATDQFNGKTVYDILGLPDNFFDEIKRVYGIQPY